MLKQSTALIAALLALNAFSPVVATAQSLLDDLYEFSGGNFPNSFGVTIDPETQQETDHGSPPFMIRFDGVEEQAGEVFINERLHEFTGVAGGISAVQASGIDGETEFQLTDWENPGEIIEFSFRTADGEWIANDDFDHSFYALTGLEWEGSANDSSPQFFETSFYFYWSKDGDLTTQYETVQPEIGLLVGEHPFDETVPEVVYIAYSESQVEDITNPFPGGMDVIAGTTQLDENNGSYSLLSSVVGLGDFGRFDFQDTANEFHVGFLVVPPEPAGMGGLLGDVDGDGDVDLTDFNILKSNFGLSPAGLEQGDTDGDGDIDLTDFNILKENFGAVAQAVPEPGAAALAVVAILTIAVRVRPRRLAASQ